MFEAESVGVISALAHDLGFGDVHADGRYGEFFYQEFFGAGVIASIAGCGISLGRHGGDLYGRDQGGVHFGGPVLRAGGGR